MEEAPAKMGKTYKATRGAPFSQSKAQAFGDCIEEIEEKNHGVVRPIQIVDAGKSKTSPLNAYFDWNDKSAGAKYRLSQARSLINHLIVVIRIGEEEREQKAYVNVNMVKDDAHIEPLYVNITKAMSNEEFRKQIIQKAMREVEYWRHRYSEYKELSHIFRAIEITKEEAVED